VDGLRWALDGIFSPDSRFVYVIDPRGSGSQIATVDGQPGALTIFQITKDGKLQWIEAYRGQGDCFNGSRGIAMHPDGKTMFIPSSSQSLLTVVSRDEKSGKLQVKQTLRDGRNGVEGLEGVSSVACSPDGRFVYTSSGRFRGDNAIGVYRSGENGQLNKVQELFNGQAGLTKFEGGNEIHVSPDGKHVSVAATLSETILDFQRDEKTGQLGAAEVTEFRTLEWLGPRLGPAGMAISPDGKHTYVALESTGAIAIFKRKSASESIKPD
jgi:6-phosphogluconolactonase (cycloisomerase 2 family)